MAIFVLRALVLSVGSTSGEDVLILFKLVVVVVVVVVVSCAIHKIRRFDLISLMGDRLQLGQELW